MKKLKILKLFGLLFFSYCLIHLSFFNYSNLETLKSNNEIKSNEIITNDIIEMNYSYNLKIVSKI